MRNTITLVLVLICSLSVSAQNDSMLESSIDMTQSTTKGSAVIGAFGEVVQLTTKKESSTSKSYNKKPVYFNEAFTGFSIQLMTSMERLDPNNELFTEFGTLMIEEATNPKFCYMIGEFVTQEGAEKFLQNVLLERYPDAKVVFYKKGNRKKIK